MPIAPSKDGNDLKSSMIKTNFWEYGKDTSLFSWIHKLCGCDTYLDFSHVPTDAVTTVVVYFSPACHNLMDSLHLETILHNSSSKTRILAVTPLLLFSSVPHTAQAPVSSHPTLYISQSTVLFIPAMQPSLGPLWVPSVFDNGVADHYRVNIITANAFWKSFRVLITGFKAL